MAVNKLLPFANGAGANVPTWADWSALTTLLGQGFVTGVARSDYANRVFSQGALASYVLGQLVVDQIAQDADLEETTFYTNFKNALKSYIEVNAVALNGAQTVGGVKTFTSSPVIPTKTSGDNSTDAASTAFVQTEIANQAVKFDSAQTLTNTQKKQARSNTDSAENNVTPIGSYIYFAGSSVPTHYLLCNGSAVSRTDYAVLYAVIGDTYGAGNGSTTFNLPNLIDKFLEGSTFSGIARAAKLPDARGFFSIRKVGGDADVILSSSGALSYSSVSANVSRLNTLSEAGAVGVIDLRASDYNSIYDINTGTVQPPALTALPCIRYE